MFYLFFVIIYLITLFSLLFKQRCFDFLSIYITSLLLFNFSTFLGVVKDPYIGQFVQPNDYLFFYSSIPILVALFFLLLSPTSSNKHFNVINSNEYNIFLNILLVFFCYCLFDNRDAFWGHTTKMTMMDDLKFSSMLLLPIPSIGSVLSIMYKKYFYLALFVLGALVLFFLGSRSPLAILGLCVAIQYLSDKRILIAEHYKLALIGFTGLFVIILGKRLYGSILAYGLADGVAYWAKNFDIQYFAEGSEFLSTPLILNAVIEKDFSIPATDVLESLLAILPIPMSFWGLRSSIFNDKFQSALFSDMNYGMAYNIWAEAYSWLDLVGVIIYSIIIPYSLIYLWKVYKKNYGNAFSALVLFIGVLLAFWIHRNSIGSILGYIRNALYPTLFFILLFQIIKKLKIKITNK